MINKKCNMPKLSIGDLTSKLPIIQGGMGIGVSGASLVSAVSNEGGIGVLSAAGMGFELPGYKNNPIKCSIQALKDDIKKVRERTGGIFGINIMVALTNFPEMVSTAIDEKVDIIFAGAGLPLDLPKYLVKGAKTKLVPIISSAKAANLLIRNWVRKYHYVPDAFVVEGPMAGGHIGVKTEELDREEYSLETIIPQVVAIVRAYEEQLGKKIPVIAAGGIYTGADIRRFMDMGASGVQMGTRFVATEECDASMEFKKSYVNCKKEDLMIITSPVGMPGRAIRNSFLQSMEDGKKQPVNCPFHCIKTCQLENSPYCISTALINARKGNLKNGFAFAGQNAYRTTDILSVRELIESLEAEYLQVSQIEIRKGY